ncbi:MAG: hypothetical protein GAK28_01010 [Luteibacter sp.]|nr:MAG: hypothetical protein GAK28_01010 [Luteibacter sp.]
MHIHGGCHCGNIVFDLAWPESLPIPARACTCAFCRKHAAVWTANPGASLEVHIKDASRVSRHAFETRTADFHVCSICGVVPVCTSDIDGHRYAVVNVRSFEGDVPVTDPVSVSFDGEGQGDRLARRAKNWIGTVSFHGA